MATREILNSYHPVLSESNTGSGGFIVFSFEPIGFGAEAAPVALGPFRTLWGARRAWSRAAVWGADLGVRPQILHNTPEARSDIRRQFEEYEERRAG
jgi:hypothetical protein